MKNKLLLLAAIFCPFFSISAFDFGFVSIEFYEPIGPFHVYNEDVDITFKVSSSRTYTNLRERLQLSSISFDEFFPYTYTTQAHSIGMNRSVDVTMTLPLSTMLSNNGLKGEISVIGSKSTLTSVEFKLKPQVPQTIDINDYRSKGLATDDVVIDLNAYSLRHREFMSFTDIVDYFDVNYYYRIALEVMYIDYSCFLPFPGGEAYLHFDDYNGLFPYIDKPGNVPYFDIPLVIKYKEECIWFEFPPTMYVNPKTLEMSLEARSGFQLTKYFYLPVNKRNQMVDQDFYLNVSNFGYGAVNFSFKIRYLNNRGLIGDCDNSDYCIIGEVK